MEALRTWTRHLVVLAVLIGLAEIALPRSNLRQPARLVLGLLLLLAVAQPFLSWVKTPVRWDDALAAAATGLPDYRPEADRLARATADLTRQELQRRLELTAEVAARQVPGVGGARARVQLGDAPAGQPPPVTAVQLWVRPAADRRISAVAPVVVGAPAPASPPDPAAAPLMGAAVRAVAQSLGVPSEKVTAGLLSASEASDASEAQAAKGAQVSQGGVGGGVLQPPAGPGLARRTVRAAKGAPHGPLPRSGLRPWGA